MGFDDFIFSLMSFPGSEIEAQSGFVAQSLNIFLFLFLPFTTDLLNNCVHTIRFKLLPSCAKARRLPGDCEFESW